MARGITVCAQPGCPTLTDGTRCPTHRRARQRATDQRRGTRQERGYDNDWLQLRNRIIDDHVARRGYTCPGWDGPPHFADPKSNPLTGDHIIELHEGGQRLDPANIAVLCRSCNTAKSHSRRGVGMDPRGGGGGGT